MAQSIAVNAVIAISAGALALYHDLPWIVVLAPIVAPPVAFLLGGRHALAIFWRVCLPFMLAIGMIYLYIWSHRFAWLKENFLDWPVSGSTGEEFFSVMATLYAVTTALILIKAIEAFDRLNTIIVEESDKVRSLAEFLFYLQSADNQQNNALVDSIRDRLGLYLLGARREPTLAAGNGGLRELEMCAKYVSQVQCADENDRIALGEIIKGLNELFSIRARRIGFSRYRLPGYLVFMLGAMSFAMILMFFVEPSDRFTHSYTMIFILTLFSSFVIILLQDINNPLEGFWKIDLTPYEEAHAYIEQRPVEAG